MDTGLRSQIPQQRPAANKNAVQKELTTWQRPSFLYLAVITALANYKRSIVLIRI